MYRGPSACKYCGQAVDGYVIPATNRKNGFPRQNVRSRNSCRNNATGVSGEGGTLQMVKYREEEEKYEHDGVKSGLSGSIGRYKYAVGDL